MVRDVDHLREEHDHVVGIGDREETTVADVVLPNPVAGDLFDILKVSLKESTFIKKKDQV